MLANKAAWSVQKNHRLPERGFWAHVVTGPVLGSFARGSQSRTLYGTLSRM